MVAARAMTINKYLFLILVLFVSTSINVLAQDQDNLLIDVLDRMKQLQNEVTELRNQNELTQYKLKSFQKNLDAQLTELKMQIDVLSTTSTRPVEFRRATPVDTQLKAYRDDFQRLNLKINKINSRLQVLARIVKNFQPMPQQERKQPPPSRPEETTPQRKQPPPPRTEETTPQRKQPPPPRPEETTPQPEQAEKMEPIKPAKLLDENEYAAYSQAMGALDRADYTRLRDNLTRFLQDYPKGDYADDANYWIAEAYYAEQKLELAESYFTQLIENYEDSEKREDALLKIAYIRLNNEQWEAARNVLELLENEAEDEQIRKLAIEQLKRLESEGR